MSRMNKAIEGVRKFGPYLQMIEEGYTPSQIKEMCYQVIGQHLKNPHYLDYVPIEGLYRETVNVSRIIADDWADPHFDRCLDVYRAACHVAPNLVFDTCVIVEQETLPALAKFWSVCQLERPRDELSLEEFTLDSFAVMGQLLEGVMLPFLRGFLYIVRIANGGDTRAIEEVRVLNLGKIIGELNAQPIFSDLFSPAPWNVPLNQWRNVAQHHSYEVIGSRIICKYGDKKKQKELHLSREELFELVTRIYRIYMVVKTARILFLIDNADEFSKRDFPRATRDDQEAFEFAIQASTQGFEVLEITETENEVSAVLRDCSDMDPKARQVHASQFAYVLWTWKQKEYSRIEYRAKNNKPMLVTRMKGEDCAEVKSGRVPFTQLAMRAEFKVVDDADTPTS